MNTRDYAKGFFNDETTQASIRALAYSFEPITIFVGAGLSADQGIPTWAALVRRLLEVRLPHAGSGGEEADYLADYLVRAYHQLPSASIVDELISGEDASRFKEVRNEEIRGLLNANLGTPRRGSMAQYLLILAITLKQAGRDVHIVTTNYDDSLLRQCEQELVKAAATDANVSFQRFTGELPGTPVEGAVPICHIHGFVSTETDQDSENVVFSESDYIEWTRPPGAEKSYPEWSTYLKHRLELGQFFFVGTTLRDYNISTILAETPSEHARIALLPIQGDPLVEVFPVGASVHDYLAQRCRHLHVLALRPDFFTQVYQFLHEVTITIPPTGNSFKPYSERLRDWWGQWSSSPSQTTGGRVEAGEELVRLCKNLRGYVGNDVAWIKVEIWVRSDPNESQRYLERWASSQVALIEGAHPHRAPMNELGRYAVVDAFADRAASSGRFLTEAPTRWTDYLAVPIVIKDESEAELPIGAVIACFDAPSVSRASYDAVLPSLLRHRATVVSRLAEVATSLLAVGT